VAANVGKRRLLLQARAEGKTLADAAKAAGMSTRQAERLSVDPTFKAELQQRLAQLDAEDQRAMLQHRRRVLAVAGHALAQQLDLMGSTAPAVVRERAARAVQEHLTKLLPQALDVAVVNAELSGAEEPQRRSFEQLYQLPPDADDAEVIDTVRAVYDPERVRAIYEQIRSRRAAVASEFPRAQDDRPGLELVPPEPEPPLVEPGPVVSAVQVESRWSDLLAKHTLTPDEQRELDQLPAMLEAARHREVPDRFAQYSTSDGRR
jgi:hypothetical protein